MSMHEIEDMVTEAVEVLHAHDGGDDLRHLFHALYEFEAGFDTSFTHGRVLDILVERRFVLKLDLSCHPRYPGNEARFSEAARSDSISFVEREVLAQDTDEEDEEGYDDEDYEGDGGDDEDEPDGAEHAPPRIGHEQGFVCDGALFCQIGTPLFVELVARGVIVGADAVPPQPTALHALVLRICRAARSADQPMTAAAWYDLGPRHLFRERFVRQVEKGEVLGRNPFSGKDIIARKREFIPVPPTPAELEALPEARALRDLARAMQLDSIELPYSTRPAREDRQDFERWWWGE